MQAFFAIGIFVRIIYTVIFVELPATLLRSVPLALAAGLLGMLLGSYAFKKMNTAAVKKAVYIVMALAGIWFLSGVSFT